MAATDIHTLIYNGLWALLEGRAAWAALVQPGNRIKLAVNAFPFKKVWQDADYPMAVMTQGGGAFSEANEMKTFGTFAATPCQARVMTISRDFWLGLTYRDTQLAANNQLLLETHAALQEGLADLSATLSAVVSYGKLRQFGPLTFDHDDTGKRNPPLVTVIEKGGKPRAWSLIRIATVSVFNTAAANTMLGR